jgi:hypothetical protein
VSIVAEKRDASVKVAMSFWFRAKSPQVVIRLRVLNEDFYGYIKKIHNVIKSKFQTSWVIISNSKGERKEFVLHMAIIYLFIGGTQ